MKDNAVILFTRIPEPGTTKTRLQPFLSAQECCKLQTAFIMDIFSVLLQLESNCDIILCFAPQGDPQKLHALYPSEAPLRSFAQRGASLGERMHHAIGDTLSLGYRNCVLIGSDLPLLEARAIDEAFALLARFDTVLCPTQDGGYYLIGMKEPMEPVFHMEYSNDSVFETTLERIGRMGKTCAIGAQGLDVDNEEDILALAKALSIAPQYRCSNTREMLAHLLLIGGSA